MKTRKLGRSDLVVSEFCLGSMTWGSQNTTEEGHAQIDYALDHGINFIDTAEIYPTTPSSPETAGETERVIGRWFAAHGRRDEVILATKVKGRDRSGADPKPLTPARLLAALDESLGRLRTDYVDLYQIHWPNRATYHFREAWDYDPSTQATGQVEDMHALLEAMGAAIASGKVRHFGLSNETAWGTAMFLKLSEQHGLPRVVSLQNEYSLLDRVYDIDLAELCWHEEIGLLAWSPLAAGFLTGKYAGGARPAGSRGAMQEGLNGRMNPHSEPAVAAYVALACEHGLDPAQMALAFCASRPTMGSVILGATSMEQLATDIAAAEISLSPEVLEGIAAIRRKHPMPF